VLTKQAEREGSFGSCDAAWVPLTNGPVEREYRLVPDRDLNGAGLVYFANYPMFLDICERDVLLSARRPLAESLIDRRTLVRRQSAYLNNASAHETLRVEIEPWIQAREAPHVGGVETVDLRLHVNCRMYRRSDDRLMMVSTVQKVMRAVPVGDTPLAE
jgi:probable biosynthetic protein (TIGR04098 family)